MSDEQAKIEETDQDDLTEQEKTDDNDEVNDDDGLDGDGLDEDTEEGDEDEQPEKEAEDGDPFGVWDDSVEVERIKVLLYGVSGTGKTTMAATFPSPIFLDLEGGMLSTRRIQPVLRFPKNPKESIKSYPQVVEFYNLVRNAKNPKFKTIVIDSLNELQTLVTQYVVGKFNKVKRQYDDQLTLADYGKANRDFSKVVRLFLNLPYHIVFTAVSTQKESGEDGNIQIAPKFVGKQVGPDVQRMMDMIGYCHAKRVAAGQNQHFVSFHISSEYLAKDRLGIVDRDIPNNYDALVSSVKGAN